MSVGFLWFLIWVYTVSSGLSVRWLSAESDLGLHCLLRAVCPNV